MNYRKLVLVGFISAFVAVLTSVLGVAGTVIGSVISSVLYNMLSEALEKPVSGVSIKHNFEWDVAYVFPLIVIALIQLLLICSFLAEANILPGTFLNVYLSLQNFANNNLYKILGLALIVISVYPLILKPENVKKIHGIIIAVIGLIFLARGFVDIGNRITDLYRPIFEYFDFPIAVITLLLLVFVIIAILMSAKESDNNSKMISNDDGEEIFTENHVSYRNDFDHPGRRVVKVRNKPPVDTTFKRKISHNVENHSQVNNVSHKSRITKFQRDIPKQNPQTKYESNGVSNKGDISNHESKINRSSKNIQFESNDLLEEYKK